MTSLGVPLCPPFPQGDGQAVAVVRDHQQGARLPEEEILVDAVWPVEVAGEEAWRPGAAAPGEGARRGALIGGPVLA